MHVQTISFVCAMSSLLCTLPPILRFNREDSLDVC